MQAQTQQHIAETAMATGGTLTVGSWIAALFGFLDAHQPGILALCGLAGLCISLWGAWLGYKAHKLNMTIKREQLRQLKNQSE